MGKFKVLFSSTSYAFAQLGTFKTFLSASSIFHSSTWIIDSRVIDHMTNESNVFLSCIPCSSNQKVQVANGSLTPINDKDNVSITLNITLSSVLHVSNMFCNLLFINKLTKSQNYSITFFPTNFVFQNLTMRKMIGSAKEREGFYYVVTKE